MLGGDLTAAAGRGRGRAAAALRLALVLLFCVPLLAVLAGSLRRVGVPPPGGVDLLPHDPGLTAYRELGQVLPLGRLVRNSLTVVAVAVPVTTVVASWAGCALAQLTDPWRRRLLAGVWVLLLVPLPVVWVARFVLYLRLGVLDTLVPLMAPALAATTPFTVLLAYRACRRVPPQLWEAARLEGAGALRTWWRVALPLTKSTTLAIAAVAFATHWGNYLDAALYVRTPDVRTLPLGLAELAALDRVELPLQLAGAVLLVVPPLLALALVARPLLGSADLQATGR